MQTSWKRSLFKILVQAGLSVSLFLSGAIRTDGARAVAIIADTHLKLINFHLRSSADITIKAPSVEIVGGLMEAPTLNIRTQILSFN